MDQSTDKCSVDLCLSTKKHGGLCGAHYQRKRAGLTLTVRPTEVSCSDCGTSIPVSMHGPVPEYCSGCRRDRKVTSAKAGYVVPPLERSCVEPGCAEVLRRVPGKRGASLCEKHSVDRVKVRKRDAGSDNHNLECSEDACDRPVRAKNLCSMHYKRVARSEGRIKNAPWDDRRRSNHHARRARKMGSPVTSVALLIDIVERDGTDCAGCGDGVDLSIKWPDPFSKSVDHTMPLSRGGAHSLENCQLMHLRCNISKGARVAA